MSRLSRYECGFRTALQPFSMTDALVVRSYLARINDFSFTAHVIYPITYYRYGS